MQGGHPDDGLLDVCTGRRPNRFAVEAEVSLPSMRLVNSGDLEHSTVDKAIQAMRGAAALMVNAP